MGHRFDITNLPLVRAGFDGDITEAGIRAYLRELEALIDRGDRFGMVFDALDVGNVERVVVSLHADFLKREKVRCSKQWVGLALVFDSPGTRFLLSSLLLMVKLPMPYEVVATRDLGMRYIARRLAEEQLPLPAPLRGLNR